MTSILTREDLPLAEPFALGDTFVFQIGRAERIGSNTRLYFTVPVGLPGSQCLEVVVRLMVPNEALASIARHMLEIAASPAPQPVFALAGEALQ